MKKVQITQISDDRFLIEYYIARNRVDVKVLSRKEFLALAPTFPTWLHGE